ncbi:glycosyltransferase [Flavobacterium sp. NKUCC04_CG]|uniref:glycosyltransferase n=1 Tax=Flavobacterium sp. NKUCC04_CG TaxID=2842121 RepID=UPI001C5B0BA4|nr:glycosyltransferase [Flavobacterium sp. NKUCC04_CG]MBW3518023.1 glycosyltransferase [Flavobacterium sp. NKUCC04_CG]
MKIVYLSTQISSSGGAAKVTASKVNYFIENWGYEVSIISSNDEIEKTFFEFNPQVKFYFLNHKMKNPFSIISFYKQVNVLIKIINPDVILVNDNGFKAYFASLFIKKKNLWFEIHGSRIFLLQDKRSTIENRLILGVSNLLYKKFDKIILLNEESKTEWNHRDIAIIPNFVEPVSKIGINKIHSNRIIAVGRISVEKGYDRMLTVFEKVVADFPDWSLHIYGKIEDVGLYHSLLERKVPQVFFYGETLSIEEKIIESEFLIHAAYHEGMGMVLVEALNLGKVVVAFDVPFVVNGIIKDSINGFLAEDNNLLQFEEKMRLLIEDKELLSRMETTTKKSIPTYQLEGVVGQWERLFRSL